MNMGVFLSILSFLADILHFIKVCPKFYIEIPAKKKNRANDQSGNEGDYYLLNVINKHPKVPAHNVEVYVDEFYQKNFEDSEYENISLNFPIRLTWQQPVRYSLPTLHSKGTITYLVHKNNEIVLSGSCPNDFDYSLKSNKEYLLRVYVQSEEVRSKNWYLTFSIINNVIQYITVKEI